MKIEQKAQMGKRYGPFTLSPSKGTGRGLTPLAVVMARLAKPAVAISLCLWVLAAGPAEAAAITSAATGNWEAGGEEGSGEGTAEQHVVSEEAAATATTSDAEVTE